MNTMDTFMTRYADPVAYANLTNIPVEKAESWCGYFAQKHQRVMAASHCPQCGKQTLQYVGVDGREWVCCENNRVSATDSAGKVHMGRCGFERAVRPDDKDLLSPYAFADMIFFLAVTRLFRGTPKEWEATVEHIMVTQMSE
ncbi:hypothetical protein J2T17_004426 [Paenibacillus mucilaginosus]|uniref:hypothetical protein n=1 Tax=Paenibacillus mucilaginosus TaxID=61624 RepID=UPI003D23734E